MAPLYTTRAFCEGTRAFDGDDVKACSIDSGQPHNVPNGNLRAGHMPVLLTWENLIELRRARRS